MDSFFKQPCPICGRPLHVPIILLGGEAACNHCSGVFTANGNAEDSLGHFRAWSGEPPSKQSQALLRTEEIRNRFSSFTSRTHELLEHAKSQNDKAQAIAPAMPLHG